MIAINDIEYNSLDEFFNALPEHLAGNRPLTLNLSESFLYLLDDERWQALCTAMQTIQQPLVLRLNNNNLHQLDVVRWQAFCNAIQTCQQPLTLSLRGNQLQLLDAARCLDLCTAIQTSQQPLSLDLSGNLLHEMDAANWQVLCNAMQMSQQPLRVYLSVNQLQQLDADRWQVLCTAIQMSQQPLSLDLALNDLDELDPLHWQALCTAIQLSHQPLTLDLISGADLSPEKITTLKEALSRSSGMHKITVGNPEIDRELHKTLLDKRRAIHQVAGFFKKTGNLPDDALNEIGEHMVGKFSRKKGGKTFADLAEKFADTPHVQKGKSPKP